MAIRKERRIVETPKLIEGTSRAQERVIQATEALKQAPPDKREELQLDLEIAQQEAEGFFLDHDTTGALKGERFGQDVRSLVDAYGLERSPEGEVALRDREAAAKTHILQVNMGELDRLNASGDHSLGDTGLELTFLQIQERVGKAIPDASKFEIYRTAGNDFSVILKDVDAAQADRIRKALSVDVDISAERADQDPIPLSVSRVSLEEGIRLLNQMEESPESAGQADETALISFLRDKNQVLNDFEKVRRRGQRMLEKLREQPAAGKLDARQLYDSFLKKYVGNLFVEGKEIGPLPFETFVQRVEAMGAFDGHPHVWKARLFESARDEALKQFESRSGSKQANSQKILDSVLSDLERRAQAEELPVLHRPETAGTQQGSREFTSGHAEAIAAFHARTAVLGETEGHVKIQELEAQTQHAEAAGPHSEKRRALVNLKLENERKKRDTATGLYGRGEYFQVLESSLQEGKPVTAVSVDMAFLKFFDKEGGGKTGDQAIVTAGQILDYVKREMKQKYGINAEAYRTGGDEFALTLGTTDAKIVQEALSHINLAASDTVGPIPMFEGATKNYLPESLQFNFGTFSAESAPSFREKLSAWGIKLSSEPGSADELKELSDTLNHIADQGVESEKSVNRLVFLLSRSIEEERTGPGSLMSLRSYSEKSIFGSLGREQMARWKQALLDKAMTIGEIVSDELVPFVTEQLRLKGKKDVAFETVVINRLKGELRLSFAELRISELETELESAQNELGEKDKKVLELRKNLTATQQEHKEIVDMRSRIAAA